MMEKKKNLHFHGEREGSSPRAGGRGGGVVSGRGRFREDGEKWTGLVSVEFYNTS